MIWPAVVPSRRPPGRGIGYVMSMQPAAWPEPDPLVAAAIAAKYRGKRPRPLAVLIRDRLGQWLEDEDFAQAFGIRGRPGWSPSRLALVTVLQRAGNLTGRRLRQCGPAWTGNTCSACPSMTRALITRCWPGSGAGWPMAAWSRWRWMRCWAGWPGQAWSRQAASSAPDSTHVIAVVAALNRLELAGESVRAALEALTAAHPAWLEQRVCVADFARRYGTPMTSWRPPVSQARRDELAVAYAKDGYALLEAVYDGSSPAWLRELPAVDVLGRVLLQNYTRTTTKDGREVIRRREKEPDGDGLPPGHARIASPYDTDARWGVKREEFWLGCKLHITETCDDPPPCTCRPGPAAHQLAAGGRDHDQGCAQVCFPNMITSVATTGATVTGNQMTGAIGDDLAAKNLTRRRHYLDSGYLSAALVVSELARHGIALTGPLLARHLRAGPRRPRLRPRRLHRRLRQQDRHLPARRDISVLDTGHVEGQGRDRGHLLRHRLRPLPGSQPVHCQRQEPAPAHRAGPRGLAQAQAAARTAEQSIHFPARLRPPRRRRRHHAPGRRPRRAARPLPQPVQDPPRPRLHGHRAQPATAGGILDWHAPGPAANQPPGTPRTRPRRIEPESPPGSFSGPNSPSESGGEAVLRCSADRRRDELRRRPVRPLPRPSSLVAGSRCCVPVSIASMRFRSSSRSSVRSAPDSSAMRLSLLRTCDSFRWPLRHCAGGRQGLGRSPDLAAVGKFVHQGRGGA